MYVSFFLLPPLLFGVFLLYLSFPSPLTPYCHFQHFYFHILQHIPIFFPTSFLLLQHLCIITQTIPVSSSTTPLRKTPFHPFHGRSHLPPQHARLSLLLLHSLRISPSLQPPTLSPSALWSTQFHFTVQPNSLFTSFIYISTTFKHRFLCDIDFFHYYIILLIVTLPVSCYYIV